MANIALRHNAYEFLRKSNLLRRIVRETLATYRLLRNKAKAFCNDGLSKRPMKTYQQSIPAFDVTTPPVLNGEKFIEECRRIGLKMSFGRHAIYLPPQSRLGNLLGDAVGHFPPDTGFKILRRFRAPSDATYLSNVEEQRVTNWMLGPVTNQALAAGALHAFGLGPECYGIVHLKNGPTDMTAFAVRHVDGEVAKRKESIEFRKKIQSLVDRGIFDLIPARGLRSHDFLPPSCNGNLLNESGSGQIQYVDFQQLAVNQKAAITAILEEGTNALHFGGSSVILRRGRSYLYQSLPIFSKAAKRDCSFRWQEYEKLLGLHGVALKSRVVLDVCCNSGMMMAHALSRGADWCVGWDLPSVIPHTKRILHTLGAGRSSLISAELNPDYRIAETIPGWIKPKLDDSVVFYLAAIEHVGIVRQLAAVPWKTMLFEGHQGVCPSEEEHQLREIQEQLDCCLIAKRKISDGDCGSRTVALFSR